MRAVPGQSEAELAILLTALDASPNGGTPLCEHIRAIIEEVRMATPTLRQNGQKAVVVICTDGEASDGNLMEAIRPMKDLPIQLVLRLCTDDESVGNYWNSIDQQLELGMDLLDDFLGESREVQSHCQWLTYGEPVHRLREWGVIIKEFDLLDEKPLNAEQARAVIAYL
jgi:hypothetical protein